MYRYSESAQDKPSDVGGIVFSVINNYSEMSGKTIKMAIDTNGDIFVSVFDAINQTYGTWKKVKFE